MSDGGPTHPSSGARPAAPVRAVACLALAFASFTAWAAPQGEDEQERQRIADERTQAHAAYAEEEKRCLKQFVVTPCIDAAKRRRRDALAPLRQQEIQLDRAQRKQRADERRAVIQDKEATGAPAADSAASAPGAAASAASDVASAPTQSRPPRVGKKLSGPDEGAAAQRAAERAGQAGEAARRAQSQREKAQAAAKHRQAVEKRNAERRDSDRPPSQGLPVPASGAASSP